MTPSEAKKIAGSIGFPSKMPGTSYGLPAAECVTGSKLAKIEGSICNKCYALKGNYQYPVVQNAQYNRLSAIEHDDWVGAMVVLLRHHHNRLHNGKRLPNYHRWHDSGDIQSVEHLQKICSVAQMTPWLHHWLPTREMGFVKQFLKDGGVIPNNLRVRASSTMVDGPPPNWPYTAVVVDRTKGDGYDCLAPLQGNKCGPCRACWEETPNVVLHLH